MTGRGMAGLRPCMWELACGCLPEDWPARMSAKAVRACSKRKVIIVMRPGTVGVYTAPNLLVMIQELQYFSLLFILNLSEDGARLWCNMKAVARLLSACFEALMIRACDL